MAEITQIVDDIITKVNDHTTNKADKSQVLTNVPVGAVFTDNDTTYSPATPGTNGTDGVDGLLEDSDKYKLNNIEAGATADQTKVDIEGLAINASSLTEDTTHRLVTDTEKSTWSSKQDVLGFTAEDSANKGVANGYASLDASGLVPSTQLPSFVDDVVMAANLTTIEAINPLESSKIYIAEDTNITYRWSGTGTTMIAIGSDLALGETSSTAYRGDLGKVAYDHSQVAHAPSNADNTAINETSHADVLVDGDFGAAGIMKTDGLGTYSIDNNTYIQTSHSANNISSGDITNLSNLSGTNSGDEPAVTTTTGGVLTDVQAVKFDGIATGATANDTDANLKNRINHTGTQTASTISDFDTEVGNHTDVSENTISRHNHTYGIADTNTVQISVVDVADDDYARFTATGLEGRTLTEMVTDMNLSSSDISDVSVNADQTSANETSHGNIALGTSTITNTALDANLEITGNGTGKANIDGNALTATTATNVTDTSVAQDSTFDTTAGLVKSDGDGTYSVDTNTYLTSETSHSDVVVDGDFTSEGLMYRDVAAGSYSMKTIGTGADNIIALDGTSKLPAVDGSALTGIDGLPDQTGHSGQYLQTNGTAADWAELSGTGLSYVIKDVNYTASVGDYILADTSTAGFTVTLPSTPTNGDIVTVLDTSGTFGANALTLSSDSTINGIGSGAELTHSNTVTVLMYDGTTWKTYLQRNVVGSVASENVTGPSVGNECTEVELVIDNYDYTNEYVAAVNGGDVSVAFDRVVWNLPAVDADTTYTLTLTVNGSTEIKYQVLVININVLSDDAISVTDFSINSTNTGWTI